VVSTLTVQLPVPGQSVSAGVDISETRSQSADWSLAPPAHVEQMLTALRPEGQRCASVSQAIPVILTPTACLTRALAVLVARELSVRTMEELLSVNAPHSISGTHM